MLRQATRTKAKIRLGLSAVSGGGKTYSAILIAKGLSNGDLSKVAIIDTENGSADLYAHMGNYNVFTLNAPFSPERYIDAIKTCEDAGMNVIIIDSITHEWDGKGGCLQIQEQLGGKYQDWAKVTPRHQAFIDAILQAKCHMITTVRRKQDYEMTKDAGGKMKVEKAGLKEVTREGFEYELTANIELDIRHNATALKDRTGLFMDQPQFVPSEQTGKMLLQWCENGTPTTADKVELIKTKLNMQEVTDAWFLTDDVKKEIEHLIKNSTLESARKTVARKSLATCVNDKMVDHIRQALLKFQN
jgi:hypothetical protein